MAEPSSVAGGVVSFIGLSGQVLQGIKFLHGFLSDIKDAPEDVKTLNAELKLIDTILEEVQRQDNDIQQCPSMLEAVNYCKSWVDKLEDLVRACEPGNGKKMARLWGQLGIALRTKKLTKYINGLERAKSLLLQARVDLSR
ncbi:hypothetical protein F5882DRAFT_362532 [Hyaloscypha sp. PMI_1271]|nr:hypothetical protein F5882DRAFT_362532 [Hyaloscypha sp. PMI_1271]